MPVAHIGKVRWKMSEIKFSDGMPKRERRSSTSIYPEELLDKKCGGCVRCQPRKRKGETGYHCTTQPYIKDISTEDKACVIYWDKEEEERYKALTAQDEENRRKELWNIYSKREPIKLPIVNDGHGMIPECPICGEMPYSTEQCHWCGQRFIQDEEVKEYTKPLTKEVTCFSYGRKVIASVSKYNGHISYHCQCGTSFIE